MLTDVFQDSGPFFIRVNLEPLPAPAITLIIVYYFGVSSFLFLDESCDGSRMSIKTLEWRQLRQTVSI